MRNDSLPSDMIQVRGLRVQTILGVYAWERQRQRDVIIDLDFTVDAAVAAAGDDVTNTLDYKAITRAIAAFVGESRCLLLETLAERTAQTLLKEFSLPWIRLKITKPWALRNMRDVSVVIERRSSVTGESA